MNIGKFFSKLCPTASGKTVMGCSQCVGIESHFDQKVARRDLENYRNNKLDETTSVLIDALKSESISEMTLLDIGGGVGAIQHELLKAGVTSCINAEASQAYINAEKEEAERQGHADRIQHLHGNFVELSSDIPPCDIVTLDRTICCYHDVQGLVETSSALARRLYGVVYPLDNWKTRIAGVFENLTYRTHRSPFRFFVHPTQAVEQTVYAKGFERRFYREVGMWQVVIYAKTHP